MAGTISEKPQPLILPGSAETNPKHICFFNSHFAVVIYNFKILFPPDVEDQNILKIQNGYLFTKEGQSASLFCSCLCIWGRVSNLKEGSAEKTQSPNASRFCYILRRIIIRCKGWIPVWSQLCEHFSFRFRGGLQPTGLQKTKLHFLQHNI